MARLPARPNFDHLKKQAKDLLRLYHAQSRQAYVRFRAALPAARDKDDAALAALELKLRDAQSCIAREYGLPSWDALKSYVDWRNAQASSAREHAVPLWLNILYGHDNDRARPELAARMLTERPDLAGGDLMLACAVGDESAVRWAIAADPAAVNRTGSAWRCPGCKRMLDRPPLVAVTHSSLLALPEFAEKLRSCAQLLLDAGADPNQTWTEADHPLSALYGAAGKNGDEPLTAMLLGAGANPNDGESLYHAVEHSPDHGCLERLLEAGAAVDGSNALQHMLDYDDLRGLKLLLAYTRDANDPASAVARPLIWAIRRRRSLAHIDALLAAGADPRAATNDGTSAYRFALEYGLPDVAAHLKEAGGGDTDGSDTDDFVAACARADEAAARAILTRRPDIFGALSERQLKQLPNLVEARQFTAVRVMVELGWPIAARGGDWNATALNHAVYQGNPELARFLLQHGARWDEPNQWGDVNGILAWASRNQPPIGDWVGCARALVEHGMPLDLYGDYSEEVGAYLDAERGKRGAAT